MSQFVFQRYEKKFLLDSERFAALGRELRSFLLPDMFVRSEVSNIYYDTEDFLLIQRSLEKPKYKEKLRVRAYGAVHDESTVFVELKKKYDGVVFKRRAEMSLTEAEAFLSFGLRPAPGAECMPAPTPAVTAQNRPAAAVGNTAAPNPEVPDEVASFFSPASDPKDREQILDEIAYCRDFYKLRPMMQIAYERNSYLFRDYPDIRITFDRSIRFRAEEPDLRNPAGMKPLIAPDWTVMEIKTPLTLPAFLSHMLSANGIYSESFSKYGRAYKALVSHKA